MAQQFQAEQRTLAERKKEGRTLREKVSRKAHADYQPPSPRPDPVAILEEQGQSRIQELLPIRYARMLASPFAFLRGAAAIMASDLAPGPTTGIRVQVCGDMHIYNFGVFGSAERNLVFGISDFDETVPGPWEWDLKRLAASAVVAGRFLGASASTCEDAARAVVRTYRERLREYSEMGHLEVWYSRLDEKAVMQVLSPRMRKSAAKIIDKAREHTNLQVLHKMTDLVDDELHIREEAPFIVRETHVRNGMPVQQALEAFLRQYVPSLAEDRRQLFARYRIIDIARKVVGVGSVGLDCWILFLQGNNERDPLFLQVKQAQPSVLESHGYPSLHSNHGQRVVAGQRLIQGAPDIFLGWGELEGGHFYVRQLRDMKGSAEFTPGTADLAVFVEYCGLCGWGLAQGHAKSGDAALLSGYMGKSEMLDAAIARFAVAYADQTERDFEALAAAAKNGRIPVAKE
ncbi:MAG: DUF2252 domain-containing protein [Gemmataceae bacterium]